MPEAPEQVAELRGRVARLESILDRPLVAQALETIGQAEAPEAQAWPGDVADGQVVTAAQINSIAASVRIWQGDVNAGAFKLLNAGQVVIGRATPATLAGLEVYKASGAQVWLESGGSIDTAYVVKDPIRSYNLGINVGNVGIGRFVLWSGAAGRPLMMCDDSQIWLWLNGAARLLSVDGSGFVKAT
jgi:hypothetical protein